MEYNYSVNLKTIIDIMKFDIVHLATDYEERILTTPRLNRPGLQLAGYYEHFTQERIQLIGKMEMGYLDTLDSEMKFQKYADLMLTRVPAIVFCHSVEPDLECIQAAEEFNVTILKTDDDTSETLNKLLEVLNSFLAPRITRHGVFIEVYGEGILILGDSGVGKSEAAIELIKRGHRLIADDAVEIRKLDSHTLIGRAPRLIRYYMELRGIGVIDVRRIFGSGAVKESNQIDLVVNFVNWEEGMVFDRLGTDVHTCKILDIEVPELTIPVSPGRNLAIILEVAAMNNRQKKMGYNSAVEFTNGLTEYFENGGYSS